MRVNCKTLTIVTMLLFLEINSLGLAQEANADLKGDLEQIKNDILVVRKELADIKSLLRLSARQQNTPQIAPPATIKDIEFDIGVNPLKGSKDSTLALIEFTDYQCPFCGRFVKETLPEIAEQYIDKGLIRFAVLDQPLPMHKMAPKAAEATYCANDQGKYWEMHSLIMSKQESIENLSLYAEILKLDIGKYETCLKENKYKDRVEKHSTLARKLGIQGVPGFIIASIDPANPAKMKGISLIRGAVPLAEFQREIDMALLKMSPQKATK